MALLPFLGGCGLLGDGATRLAGDLGNAADSLSQVPATKQEVVHRPARAPYGIKGRYEILMQASDAPRSRGCLAVSDLDSPEYQKWGYNWSTTSHLNYVRVPRELRIRKEAGEATVITLERSVDGAVEVKAMH